MLDLDVTETVEALLVGILEKAKRIEESKRGLGAKLRLKGLEGGGGGTLLSRSEGRGAGDEGGNGSKLEHVWKLIGC